LQRFFAPRFAAVFGQTEPTPKLALARQIAIVYQMETTWKEMAVELHDRCDKAKKRHRRFRLSLLEIFPRKKINVSRLNELVAGLPGFPRFGRLDCEYVTDELVACFHGPTSAYETFQEIGRDIYDWLRSTDPGLPATDSYGGWLKVLYEMTRCCPAAGFEHKLEPTVVYLENISDDFEPYYRIYQYKRGPFDLSCAALRMFIEPYQTRFLRSFSSKIHLVPWQLALVFANPQVARLEPSEIATSGLKDQMTLFCHRTPTRMPRFFRGKKFGGRLLLGGRTLIELRSNASWQCLVLVEFEEQGWPEEIDTPTMLGDRFERAGRDAVRKLNKGIVGSPKIEFEAVDSGRCIRWKIVAHESR